MLLSLFVIFSRWPALDGFAPACVANDLACADVYNFTTREARGMEWEKGKIIQYFTNHEQSLMAILLTPFADPVPWICRAVNAL